MLYVRCYNRWLSWSFYTIVNQNIYFSFFFCSMFICPKVTSFTEPVSWIRCISVFLFVDANSLFCFIWLQHTALPTLIWILINSVYLFIKVAAGKSRIDKCWKLAWYCDRKTHCWYRIITIELHFCCYRQASCFAYRKVF